MDAKKEAPRLQKELDQIAVQLNVKETDITWQRMDLALKKVTKMIITYADTHRSLFTNSIRQMKENIISCLQTERTKLSCTTCEFLETTAKVSPPLSAAINDYFLPPLIKLCGRANKVVFQKATVTLCTLVTVGSPDQYLPELFKASKATSNNVRVAVAECLCLLLGAQPLAVEKWEPYLSTLEVELRSLSQDKAPDVRQKARAGIQHFLDNFPQRSEEFKASLPSAVQKALDGGTSNSKSTVSVPGFKRPISKLMISTTFTTDKNKLEQAVATPMTSCYLSTSALNLNDTPDRSKKVPRSSSSLSVSHTFPHLDIDPTITLPQKKSTSCVSTTALFTPIKPSPSAQSLLIIASATPDLASSPVAIAADKAASQPTLSMSSSAIHLFSPSPSSAPDHYPSSEPPTFSITTTSSSAPSPFTVPQPSTPTPKSLKFSTTTALGSPLSAAFAATLHRHGLPTSQLGATSNVPTLIMETRSSQPAVRAKAFEKLAQLLPTSATDLTPLQLSLIDCHISNGLHMLDAKLLAVVLTNLLHMLRAEVLPPSYFEKLLTRCLVIRHNHYLVVQKAVLQPCLAILAHFSTHPQYLSTLLAMLQRPDLKHQAKLLVLTWISALLEAHAESLHKQISGAQLVEALHPLMAETEPSIERAIKDLVLRLSEPGPLPPPVLLKGCGQEIEDANKDPILTGPS